MSIKVNLPRYVIVRPLSGGRSGFYWNPPHRDKARATKDGITFPFNIIALGVDLGQRELDDAARTWNVALDEWRAELNIMRDASSVLPSKYGTIDWLIDQYVKSRDYAANVSDRTARTYRNVFKQVGNLPTKSEQTPRFGQVSTRSITPRAADKIYEAMCEGGKFRRGEMAIKQMRRAWDVVGRLYPDTMPTPERNPWRGVALVRRASTPKAAVTRDVVYHFAEEALRQGKPEAAAAAVVCFEWLQRPENTIQHFTWASYDPPAHRGWVSVQHHKTGVEGWHPLADPRTGERLYPEAEAVLACVPRRGLLVCLNAGGKPYATQAFAKLVARIRDKALRDDPERNAALTGFTLDACRHGGMTELEEAGLTEGEGMALSAHKQAKAYHGYAKRTQERAVGPSLKRRAFRVAAEAPNGTSENAGQTTGRNASADSG
ncbi:hypothetical protein DLJ53_21980 [Acuticoccus sediminis]|uniref:Phage integrase family protein n=1 Tax=Acuticoccus sediminis TaxID=2184697 RepID=A0A8B2NMW0_9HYPH|nr:hypothetical protein [Acuticoccus sediminis]RAH99217.1 hypothetical protein DLJ53_21980 [Acuticoccus sediminis]